MGNWNEIAHKMAMRHRVLFMHMSVGDDIIAGITRRYGAAVVEEVALGAVRVPNKLVHMHFGQNGDPMAKIDAFVANVDGAAPEVAALKFCFDDFTASTDVEAVLARYETSVRELQQRNPGLRIVHITVPLTRHSDVVTDLVKRVSGLGEEGTRANIARATYNQLLRARFKDDVVFDLERVMSTLPDGKRQTFTRDGVSWPSLAPAYTDDGAHLNEVGQARAALAFLDALTLETMEKTKPEKANPKQQEVAPPASSIAVHP